ncbi:MAG TPA: phage/plasmid primase, P4 family [Tepidisphaeraceae bacterium]
MTKDINDIPMKDREERCWAYVKKMPDAISGQRGHHRTFQAACECRRFGLDAAATVRVMQQFNRDKTGGEAWTDREIEHKIASAAAEVNGEFGSRLKDDSTKSNGSHKKGKTTHPTFDKAIDVGVRTTNGTLVKWWSFQLHDGGEVGRAARFNCGNGKKQVLPFTPVPGGWQLKREGKWPPLRLPEILERGLVYVVEGETCVDAAVALGLNATTSVGGAEGAPRTNWSYLAGREVVILPDNDELGEKYASNVAKILTKLEPAAFVKIVRLPTLPDHGDIVEFIEAGGTAEQIARLANATDLFDNVHEVDCEHAPDSKTSCVSNFGEQESGPNCSRVGNIDVPTFSLTDSGNGERLFHRHGDKLRFVALWKKPICYTGSYWAVDETSAVDRLALETIRALKAEGARLAQSEDDEQHLLGLKYQKHAHACEATKKKRDMVSEASKVKGAMIMPDRLDADPWLLNVKNGTIDLRTAELRPHNRLDYITKICPVEYDEFAKCPTFEAFLKAVFANKPRLISFVRRAIGYTLTGIATERAMFFHYGTGANGKSTLLGVVRELMGDYSTQTAADTLMAKRNEGIPNDIARLKGARYVSAVETDEGRYLAEGLVKRMTGGEDVLTGRFLHAEFFDFKPEFKLHLATNHKPMIRGTDPAIWDRVKLIPYNVRFYEDPAEALKECGDPTHVKDKDLPARLRDELPGILAWAVAGCIEWQAQGLGAPEEVTQATNAYRDEMDRLGDWIHERCTVGTECVSWASELFGNYQKWAEINGEKPMNQTAFGRQLNSRGYHTVRDSKSNRKTRLGIELSSLRTVPNTCSGSLS